MFMFGFLVGVSTTGVIMTVVLAKMWRTPTIKSAVKCSIVRYLTWDDDENDGHTDKRKKAKK